MPPKKQDKKKPSINQREHKKNILINIIEKVILINEKHQVYYKRYDS